MNSKTKNHVEMVKSRHHKINCRSYSIDWHGIGKELREDREFRGVSLRSVADAIGISAPFLSDVENGRRSMSDENLANLLAHLQSLPPPKPSSTLPTVDIILTDQDLNLCRGSGELLPCPFCGHWAMSAGELTPNGKATHWKISCLKSKGLVPDCCASVWATDRDQAKARSDAVERWNRRAPVSIPAPA